VGCPSSTCAVRPRAGSLLAGRGGRGIPEVEGLPSSRWATRRGLFAGSQPNLPPRLPELDAAGTDPTDGPPRRRRRAATAVAIRSARPVRRPGPVATIHAAPRRYLSAFGPCFQTPAEPTAHPSSHRVLVRQARLRLPGGERIPVVAFRAARARHTYRQGAAGSGCRLAVPVRERGHVSRQRIVRDLPAGLLRRQLSPQPLLAGPLLIRRVR